MREYWESEFASRFRRHENELQWLYCELYHGDLQAYDYFTEMLYRLWQERPEKLKRTDRSREASPDWYRGCRPAGMQMYASAFAGDLKGVRRKLDYILDCGVNCLFLMPLLESPAGREDGGRAVRDFRKVQPELGTMEDLAALADACHEKDICLCLDFVMNHTSDDHAWARRARAGEKEYQDRYLFFEDWTLPNAFEQTVPPAAPAAAPGNFTWCEDVKKVVMTTFHPYEWDLNYANPTVFNDMTDNLLNLCNHGADMIRLDDLPYIWKALGTTCRNLPQVHSLVRILRMACEIVCPGTLLLGETDPELSRAVPYFGSAERPECHLLSSGSTAAALWHTAATRDVRLLAHSLGQAFALPAGCTFLNCVRSHDAVSWALDYGFLRQFGQEEVPHRKYLNEYLTGRWTGSPARGELYNDGPRPEDACLCGTTASLCGIGTARADGDKAAMDAAIRRDIMLHAFLFTLSGMPVLCSGDEIGQENDYSYHDAPDRSGDSRNLHRGAFDWKKASRRKLKTTAEGRIFRAVTAMEKVRADHAAFDERADTWLLNTGTEHVLGIGRYYLGEQLLALFNFGDQDMTVWLNDEKCYTDPADGKETDARAVFVPAGGHRWLLHAF